jgi:hypothetical protein
MDILRLPARVCHHCGGPSYGGNVPNLLDKLSGVYNANDHPEGFRNACSSPQRAICHADQVPYGSRLLEHVESQAA